MIELFKVFRNVDNINDFGIYCIKCLDNNKIYVGSTIRSFRGRLKQHRRELKNGTHHSIHMQNCFNKYGEDSFVVTILECITDKTIVLEREQYYIDTLKPELNCAPIAGNNKGVKMRPRKEGHTLKQIESARKTIRDNNKTGHTGIHYSEKEKDYRPSIQVCGIRVCLGSFKTLEEAVNKRKDAEEYFWQPYIELLSKELKQVVIKQYKEANTPIRSNTGIEGVSYSELKQHSVFITTLDSIAINLANYLSLEEAIKFRKEAENYFYSDIYTSLDLEQKKEAIKQYKDKLKCSKITSGHQYIIWEKTYKNWCVKPKIDNVLVMLGNYKDLNKAIEVKEKALLYFNSSEYLNNKLEQRLELIEQYRQNCLLQKANNKQVGVCYIKAKSVYRAYITVNGKNISLGQYPTKELALQARKEGELKYR